MIMVSLVYIWKIWILFLLCLCTFKYPAAVFLIHFNWMSLSKATKPKGGHVRAWNFFGVRLTKTNFANNLGSRLISSRMCVRPTEHQRIINKTLYFRFIFTNSPNNTGLSLSYMFFPYSQHIKLILGASQLPLSQDLFTSQLRTGRMWSSTNPKTK